MAFNGGEHFEVQPIPVDRIALGDRVGGELVTDESSGGSGDGFEFAEKFFRAGGFAVSAVGMALSCEVEESRHAGISDSIAGLGD